MRNHWGWGTGVVGLLLLSLVIAACDMGGAPAQTPPLTPTPTPLPRGAEYFARYCQVCHPGGNKGVGPSLIGSAFTDDQIKTRVRQGKANMPAYGPDSIPDEDLQSLVDYIRSLK